MTCVSNHIPVLKLPPQDPRVTDYVLGELAGEEAAAVKQAMADEPSIQAEIDEMKIIQQLLTKGLVPQSENLLPSQREAILRRAREADRCHRITAFPAPASAARWWITASAAAVFALATAHFFFRPTDTELGPVAMKLPASAVPADIPAPVPIVPPAMPQSAADTTTFPTLNLPILTGEADLKPIVDSIRIDRRLPPPSSVRPGEILNGFSLRLNGSAAIARSAANKWHPDIRDGGASAHVATLSTELIACPWKPSAKLLLISLNGNARDDCDVGLTYHANPATVSRCRVIFDPHEGQETGVMPAKLAAGSRSTLAIEIEPAVPAGDLGTLAWSANGELGAPISLSHQSDAEPSDDARFAALVCAFGQWLTGEQAGTITEEMISALAREIASPSLQADRAEFLKLIGEALAL